MVLFYAGGIFREPSYDPIHHRTVDCKMDEKLEMKLKEHGINIIDEFCFEDLFLNLERNPDETHAFYDRHTFMERQNDEAINTILHSLRKSGEVYVWYPWSCYRLPCNLGVVFLVDNSPDKVYKALVKIEKEEV